jgi:hypothetical protein
LIVFVRANITTTDVEIPGAAYRPPLRDTAAALGPGHRSPGWRVSVEALCGQE